MPTQLTENQMTTQQKVDYINDYPMIDWRWDSRKLDIKDYLSDKWMMLANQEESTIEDVVDTVNNSIRSGQQLLESGEITLHQYKVVKDNLYLVDDNESSANMILEEASTIEDLFKRLMFWWDESDTYNNFFPEQYDRDDHDGYTYGFSWTQYDNDFGTSHETK